MKELEKLDQIELLAWSKEAKAVIEGQLESSGDCRCGACKRARKLLELPPLKDGQEQNEYSTHTNW